MDNASKILVTGASGLIGSALVRILKEEGYYHVLTPTHEKLDLCSQTAVYSYFTAHRPQYIFHLAAHVGGIADNSDYPAQFIYNNTMMQCNIFNMAQRFGVKKILFPGSACAYPAITDRTIKESDFLAGKPESTNLAYSAAKINGIVMAQSYAKEYGLGVVLPMLANTYGVWDKSSHVIPDLISKIAWVAYNKQPNLSLWGTGSPLREFIHADDVASAFVFLMNNYESSEIINVGTMEEISIFELASYIADGFGYKGNIEFDKNYPDGVMKKCLDSSKLYAMGWKPEIKLYDGLMSL